MQVTLEMWVVGSASTPVSGKQKNFIRLISPAALVVCPVNLHGARAYQHPHLTMSVGFSVSSDGVRADYRYTVATHKQSLKWSEQLSCFQPSRTPLVTHEAKLSSQSPVEPCDGRDTTVL